MKKELLYYALLLFLFGCATSVGKRTDAVLVQPIYTETSKISIYHDKIKEIKHDIKCYYDNDWTLLESKSIIDSLEYFKCKLPLKNLHKYTTPPAYLVQLFSLYKYIQNKQPLFLFLPIFIEPTRNVTEISIINNKTITKDEVSELNDIIRRYNANIMNKYY
ncbi:MAG: hypothetical protein A2509_07375 [Candidatus Edwardsbacteria bacterium RIFOXYD12_FULL_50_11]|uniref:Uncharacterized protein n=1 Tax=Candidatus Edwardsbacteria bacterium GWF2_54_11 TaxID=1817851 RepID=A0A1F5RGJ2_9BACT|nr:MAG: hypothetical protein A2502_11050 [Candidatus Edwardsbacteria bacterium RifOxyC12_full_54_24]OGF06642.1 MAG: hypothetical protein A2273_00015 [Candidatus Edwardsbacteria bacterium RifOxyA12_full_54_48]OGF10593.1 MAG: hypothetical protein A3K15_05380 [Candidatus Edwardsbacteria bacterium GWE2_54_12]OGF13444.1 MAG: hypothetical protein A2024_10805 [Candidatus Edwardsbacteria bacterium GWF2_54_11]OGF17059.1 MAG: hypothetical protein A2509_07375 [Candidatus Edwardsbacteria bacterium RIFOXYD1